MHAKAQNFERNQINAHVTCTCNNNACMHCVYARTCTHAKLRYALNGVRTQCVGATNARSLLATPRDATRRAAPIREEEKKNRDSRRRKKIEIVNQPVTPPPSSGCIGGGGGYSDLVPTGTGVCR